MNSANAAALLQQVGTWLHFVFGGDIPDDPLRLHQVAARAVLVFLVGLAIARIGKSRLISRTTALDVILGFTLGSILSRAITGNASLSATFVASAALVAVHWLLTRLAYHSHALGNLVKGNACVLVEEGQPLRLNMFHSHISDHDLEEAMRLNGIDDLASVRRAYKERSGEVSIVKRPTPPRILDIAVEDGVQTVRLELG